MSELKAETIVPQGSAITLQMYPKGEADAALAAKDKEIEGWKAGYNNLLNVDIPRIESNLKKEIAELKAALESEKASRYADSVDAGMRERRLKRALWLARDIRAKTEQSIWSMIFKTHGNEAGIYWNIKYRMSNRDGVKRMYPEEWMKICKKVERLCKAKAEEYK